MSTISDNRGFYDIYVPSLAGYYSFREITTGQQKMLCKTLMAEEGPYKTEFVKALIKVLQENVVESINVLALNIIDVMCIMLGLKCASISPKLDINVTCGSCRIKHKIGFELDTLYEKIVKRIKSFDLPLTINSKTIKLNYPSLKNELELMYKLKDDNISRKDMIVLNLLRYINDGSGTIDFFDDMSMTVFADITRHIQKLDNLFADIVVYNFKCIGDPAKEITCDKTLSRNFYINYKTFYSFYNLLYGNDLKSLYKDIFYLSKINISEEYVENISAIDRSVLWSVYSDEQKEKQKKRDKTFNI